MTTHIIVFVCFLSFHVMLIFIIYCSFSITNNTRDLYEHFCRHIAIPSDLDMQVATMFTKAQILSRQTTSKWLQVKIKELKKENTNKPSLGSNNVSNNQYCYYLLNIFSFYNY